ncbi:PAS domain S-box protein [Natrarchaeobius sp. A-rgal3]|uniref:PAS domain S-box protein n=1 Tax=Natrarchaeobius versutus TaxID=1679078 RepID=UPI00351058CB
MTVPQLTETLRETLAVFDEGGDPLTATEVAERVEVGRRSTYGRLERLVDHGLLETKNVGGNGRIWWQPSTNGREQTADGQEQTADGQEQTADGQEQTADGRETTGVGKQSGEQFRTLVDATEEYAIFMLDSGGHVRTWNAGAERIKGYVADEIVGEHVSTFYIDDDRATDVPEDNLAKAERHGSTEDEGWRVRADGSTFWANVTISAIRSDDGELEGYTKVTRDMTDRREYERRLEAKTARLERQRDELESELDDVFERISDGFYALDEQLRFIYLNDHAADVLDLDEEAVGANIRDEVVLTEPFESALYEALETQEPVILEDYYDPVDRWFYNAIYPSESGLSVYFHEITEKKRRERKLEQYERIVETVDDGIYVLDGNRRFTMVNEAFASMTGYERDELVGDAAETVFGETFVDIADEKQDELESGEKDIAHLEEDLYRADGTPVTVESRFDLFEVDGEMGRVGVVRDITGRKERERKLEQRARQQRVVSDLGQFALETTDIDELMHEASRQVAAVLDNEYCKVLDLDPESEHLLLRQGVGWADGTVGEATVSAVEGDSQAAYTLTNDHPIVVENLETESRFSGPDLLRSHDVSSGISVVIGSFDEPWGILGTHDTAPRAFTDEDVNFVQSVANVLAEAIERHQYQYQQRLERLVDDLAESNERLEQFAYAASHDLQEPLRMVSSYLQLIERRYGESFDEDGREFLEYAVDGADRMRKMIDGLLKYSRVETQGGEFEPVDLEAVVGDVRTDLQVKIENHDAEITVAQLPRVEGDEEQLRQVFQNLLSNAIEYSGDEPPRIRVTAERSGSKWIVSVADDGIGIEPEKQERIFEVFKRLHSASEHSGIGIGLALCQRIVERHGGDIWVDSEPDEGATFSFTLLDA